MPNKLLLQRLVLSLSGLLLCACQPDTETTLRVATNIWPGYETLYLARSLNLYQANTIRLVEMKSASQVAHALRNGTVEAAALTLDEALTLLQNGTLDLRVILIMDISDGADALLARPPLAELANLRGKRIGVENTATGAVLLDAALQQAHLQTEDVNIVAMTVNDHLTAWKNHQIDAVVSFEPVRSSLIDNGAKVLFDSHQIPGRILDVLVVRTDAISQHTNALKSLLSGYFSALDYLNQQPLDAAQRMYKRLGTQPEKVLEQYQGLHLPSLLENKQWLDSSSPLLKAAANNLTQLLVKHKLLSGNIAIDTLADADFLPRQEK